MITIENARLRVGILPDYGARVVSLVDKASGREWLTQGGQSTNVGEEADYGSPEAVGWDECFPTVSRWDGAGTVWGRRLRNHGDLWGRPFVVEAQDETRATLSFTGAEFRFWRELVLEGPTLTARYRVENRSGKPLPYLWALHALLAVEAGDRIELPGVDSVRATYLSLGGQAMVGGTLDWPAAAGRLPFALDVVQSRETVFAAKFLARSAAGKARVGQDGSWLELAWSDPIEDLGIWITYGGWPKPGGHQEIAIEPTTAPADHLGQAIEAGFAPLPPGGQREWWASMTVAS